MSHRSRAQSPHGTYVYVLRRVPSSTPVFSLPFLSSFAFGREATLFFGLSHASLCLFPSFLFVSFRCFFSSLCFFFTRVFFASFFSLSFSLASLFLRFFPPVFFAGPFLLLFSMPVRTCPACVRHQRLERRTPSAWWLGR